MIRVVIADDHTLMRDGLQTILELEEDIEVVGTAENGQQAYELVRTFRPHLVLMDIRMPEMDGIESTKRIKADFPETIVLVLTTFDDDTYIIDSLLNGASGFLLKDLPGEKLIDSIRDAMRGQLMLPSPIASKLATRIMKTSSTDTDNRTEKRSKHEDSLFTPQEKKIISLMIEGKNNQEIADLLFMSKGTVRNYISVIYQKIGINERAKAILYLKRYHS